MVRDGLLRAIVCGSMLLLIGLSQARAQTVDTSSTGTTPGNGVNTPVGTSPTGLPTTATTGTTPGTTTGTTGGTAGGGGALTPLTPFNQAMGTISYTNMK